MYYKIRNTLEKVEFEDIFKGEGCYVAVISLAEWFANKEKFNMGIDLEMEIENPYMTNQALKDLFMIFWK